MNASTYALIAIGLWATLASLGSELSRLPPFLLTGLALIIGSAMTWPFALRDRATWRIPIRTLALGVYGLFGYHLLLFTALKYAPPVEANLVNYLWPLLIVVLSPVIVPGTRLSARHVLAALLGFVGAAIAILGARGEATTASQGVWGFAPAAAAAFVWATYSLLTKRVPPFSTIAVGLFGLVSGVLALICHALLEPRVIPTPGEWLLLTICGVGPLGAAFLFWDLALKRGDARQIGILSYVTPLLSTTLLLLVTHRALTGSIALAAACILGAALLGARRDG